MDANLLNFLISFFAGIGANLSTNAIQNIFQKVFSRRPDIQQRLLRPASPEDFTAALGEIPGVLEALAGTGSIIIDGGIIEAFRVAHFDHQSGLISFNNTSVRAPFIQTGGNGNGQTIIGSNTELRSAGTSIQVGNGASIVISGNAGITQN
jgi:hypothetical protein